MDCVRQGASVKASGSASAHGWSPYEAASGQLQRHDPYEAASAGREYEATGEETTSRYGPMARSCTDSGS